MVGTVEGYALVHYPTPPACLLLPCDPTGSALEPADCTALSRLYAVWLLGKTCNSPAAASSWLAQQKQLPLPPADLEVGCAAHPVRFHIPPHAHRLGWMQM